MADCEPPVLDISGSNSSQDVTRVFFIDTLDSCAQRKTVMEKVQEYITSGMCMCAEKIFVV